MFRLWSSVCAVEITVLIPLWRYMSVWNKRHGLQCTVRHISRATSHAGTVVPECFKDDNASQWKSGKFDPAP